MSPFSSLLSLPSLSSSFSADSETLGRSDGEEADLNRLICLFPEAVREREISGINAMKTDKWADYLMFGAGGPETLNTNA